MKTPTAKLDAWQAVCDAATSGKWITYFDYKKESREGLTTVAMTAIGHRVMTDYDGGVRPSADLKLCATARTAMPELIAMVRERDAQIEGLKELVLCDMACATRAGAEYYNDHETGLNMMRIKKHGPCDCTRDQRIAEKMRTK